MPTKAARKASTPEAAEPLADLLRRVAAELQNAAHAVDAIPVADGDDSTSAPPRPLTQALQELDHTYQKLTCLADFLNAIAQSAPPQWALDPNPAAAGVTLAALAERLRSPAAPAARDDEANGEFELF